MTMRQSNNETTAFLLGMQRALAFLVWVVYHLFRLCLGLIIHPYMTVREIMRGRWFIPLLFFPFGILVWMFLSGRIGAWVVDVPFSFRDGVALLFATAILSIGLWQGLLLYLGMRFWVGLRR